MTTHLPLVPGSEWAEAIPPPPICVCTGISWGEVSKDHSTWEILLGIYQSTRRYIPEDLDLQQMLTSEDLCILSSNYSYHSSIREKLGLNWRLAHIARRLVKSYAFFGGECHSHIQDLWTIKVKFTLEQAMKAMKGRTGIALHLLLPRS